ncbi:MAG: hypothetical protein ABJB01_09090 [Rudaea sp.]
MMASIIFSAAALAQSAPPQPAPQTSADSQATQGRHVDKHDKKRKQQHNDNPDADVIGFLGDYEDAADGLDPIGLSEQTDAETPPRGDGP